MNISTNRQRIFALTLTALLSACAVPGKSVPVDADIASEHNPLVSAQATTPIKSLYDDLGGKSGVQSLTDQFVIELAADERIRPRFAKSDIGRFHRMMQEHLCEVTDGPCTYTGDSMERTHGGMNIASREFNAVVEALMRAMDATGLPVSTQNRLLAVLAPSRDQIINQ